MLKAAYLWTGRIWQGAFGRALGLKLLLGAMIFLLSTLHDFMIGPRATSLWRDNLTSPRAVRLRRLARWLGRLNLLLGLLTLALGVIMIR